MSISSLYNTRAVSYLKSDISPNAKPNNPRINDITARRPGARMIGLLAYHNHANS